MPHQRRKKSHHQAKNKVGKPPGTLIYTGDITDSTTELSLIKYGPNEHEVHHTHDIDAAFAGIDDSKVNWLNVEALHDTGLIAAIGAKFGLHALVLEDILNIEQMPKVEDFGTYYYVTLKMLSINEHQEIDQEHMSFILGSNYLISFQEKKGDVLEPVRKRVEAGLGKARNKGADYLLYALIDVVVDNYYYVIENMNDELTEIELKLLDQTKEDLIYVIHENKRNLFMLRKAVTPLRENLRKLSTSENKLIARDNQKYFNDVLDHLNHISQDMETQRDMLSGFVDLYNSNLSNKMNEVMKTLTIIATIFIPLTFIAGIYGMNFQNMPELSWPYGYYAALVVMAILGIGMYIYMKRKDWL